MSSNKILVFTFLLLYTVREISSHGRLMVPPARNCMWRYGYPNPVNYDDNQLYCGGHAVMYGQNKGKCGVCGDGYHEQPRPNEPGGPYANGIVVRRYVPGQVIDVEVDVTTNHNGTFELRLCQNNDPAKTITQECFDKNPLPIVDSNDPSSKSYSYTLPPGPPGTFTYKVRLPSDVTCTYCVIQWWWQVGNTWGDCPDGTSKVGCGPQETFVNCADVSIQPLAGRPPSRPPVQQDNPYQIYYRDYTKAGNPLTPLVVRDQVCVGTGTYETIPGINEWCQSNCMKYPPSCPADKCRCIRTCQATKAFREKGGQDGYCHQKCLTYSSKCPADKCECY